MARSLLLFGPQCPHLSQAYLSDIRQFVLGNPDLKSLVETIHGLPSLWPVLQQTLPHLGRIAGEEQLQKLSNFFENASLADEEALDSILLTPLTFISHIVEFLRLRIGTETGESLLFSHTTSHPCDVQGFCIGFLVAASIACSKQKAEFFQVACNALRLAVCIGALIDLDEHLHTDSNDRSSSFAVRWTTASERTHLESIVESFTSVSLISSSLNPAANDQQAYISCITDSNSVTVTIAARDASSFCTQVSSRGLWIKAVGLKGRFHHDVYAEQIGDIKSLCERDSRFKLPDAGSLCLPLRSNIDGELIDRGTLEQTALESILCKKSQWFQTVKAAISGIDIDREDIIPIGKGAFVPPSLATVPASGLSTPYLSNGLTPLSDSPTRLSNDSSPNLPHELRSMQEAIRSPAIAVIGMACRFPEADSLEEYWQLMNAGGCAVQQVPSQRFRSSELLRDPKGPFWGNFLRNPDAFDHKFFSYSSREAKSMDPQQRLLLQVAYESMESSGYFAQSTDNQALDVGCYVGVGSVDYEQNVASWDASAFSAPGTLRAFISGKISHHFGWSGPSITFDTACSSSAVAIHSACKALQANECTMALAGGVNVMTSPALFQNLAAASFLNPDGASKAFDASANGYCRGEGAGLVVLKPLEKAIQEGNTILGVIAGTAVNHGSNTTPITVPVSESQSSLYRQALSGSNITPTDVSYVEAHGTGTLVGDPIECESIRQIFGGTHRTDLLYIGSVKDNIGHTEAASGVAALIKTILMIQNRTIPKQANFSSLNLKIRPLEPDHMAITKESRSWDAQKLAAIVNNYGAGGSNAAVLIHEYSSPSLTSVATGMPVAHAAASEYPFFISARTIESLKSYCRALGLFIDSKVQTNTTTLVADLAYNLVAKQNITFEHRLNFVASSPSTLHQQLQRAAAGTSRASKASSARPVVLCFGGQSGKTVHLSRDLFESCKVLQYHVAECESACQSLGLSSLFPSIFQASEVEDMVSLHCMLFATQWACARSWLECGLKVSTLIGHSFGQLTALCVAGSISLIDGMYLVSERARLIRDQWGPEKGVMLSIDGDPDAVNALLRATEEGASACPAEVACYNGPKNVVVAGNEASIRAVEDASSSDGRNAPLKLKRLDNTHGFHSRLADSILPGLDKVVKAIHIRSPSMVVETCSVGQSWSKYDADEILQHTRTPVYFSEAVERVARRLGSAIWLEAGSGSPIIAMTRRVLGSDDNEKHVFRSTNIGNGDAHNNLAKAACELWAVGSRVQFWPFHQSQKAQYKWFNLPPYQFEKASHWLEYKAATCPNDNVLDIKKDKEQEFLCLVKEQSSADGESLFFVDTTNNTFQSCTKGHAVLGQSLCPASMYFEMAARAGQRLAGPTAPKTVAQVTELKINSPLGLNPAGDVFLSLRRVDKAKEGTTWTFSLFNSGSSADSQTITYASGIITLLASDDATVTSRFRSLKRLIGPSRCEQISGSPNANGLNGTAVYKMFDRVVNYASYFRGVRKLFAGGHEATGQVVVPNNLPQSLDRQCCNPLAVDNFLQVAGIHVNFLWDSKDDEIFLCTAIGEFLFSSRFMEEHSGQRSWTVYSNFEPTSEIHVTNDIFVFDSTGDLVLILMGAQFTAVAVKSLSRTLSRLSNLKGNHATSGGQQLRGARLTPDLIPPRPVGATGEELTATSRSSSSGMQATEESKTNSSQTLVRVQEMLCEMIEIPVEDVQPESILADLGVDSLMVTEVLSEIKKRFTVSISASEFVSIIDITSLCLRIDPLVCIRADAESMPSDDGHRVASSPPPTLIDGDMNERYAMNGFAPTILESFAKTKETFDTVASETGFLGFCGTVYPAQAELVVAYVVEAFTALGCKIAEFRDGEQLPAIQYVSKHEQVVRQLYSILQDAGLIVAQGEAFVRSDIEYLSASSQALHTTIVDRFPQHSFEHRLLQETGPSLAECLTSRADPLALLFGGAEARKLMGEVYRSAPMFKAGTIVLAQYLVDIFHQLNTDREIRVLELGAGTGGTTKYLIGQLAACNQKFQYTFTDLSSSMVAAAKKTFKKYSFMQYAVLDIEQSPAAKFLGQYDIIISTNCIHATRDLTKSCTNIKNMLRENGVLCLVELTQNLFWFDLVFGLLEGWWLFEDGRRHALANELLWNQCLRQAGFQWVDWTEGASKESDILRVIVASPTNLLQSAEGDSVRSTQTSLVTQETVRFEEVDGTELFADIYYPKQASSSNKALAVGAVISSK